MTPRAASEQITTYYLQMLQPPPPTKEVPAPEGASIVLCRPTVAFYLELYNEVGSDWSWTDRNKLSTEELEKIVGSEEVEIYLLKLRGIVAGYAELDRRNKPDIELAYFGLKPRFVGRGLGPYLLGWSVNKAWERHPKRLWVHTCSLDHPKALSTYLGAGFAQYKQETHPADS